MPWLFIATLLFLNQTTAKYYTSYKIAECNDVIRSDEGFKLPLGKHCEITIITPPGRSTNIDFFWKEKKRCEFSDLQVIENESDDTVEPCLNKEETAFFMSGEARIYRLKLNNLMEEVSVHTHMVKNRYNCNDHLPTKMWGVPVQFTNGHMNNFPTSTGYRRPTGCALLVPTSSILKIEPITPTIEKCDTRIEVAQGFDLKSFSTSTGKLCLDETLEIPAYCGVAVLHLYAPKNTSIRVTIQQPKKDYTLRRYSDECYPTIISEEKF